MPRPIAHRAAAIAAAALAIAGPGCAPDDRPPSGGTRSPAGPYVVVAVDNHFHDIHPEDRKGIPAGRGFTVRNEGRNLHNFTVAGTGVSFDLEPGEARSWRRIGAVLEPGTYTVVCKYHDWDGMTGEFSVVA